jgi:hypothetical protein
VGSLAGVACSGSSGCPSLEQNTWRTKPPWLFDHLTTYLGVFVSGVGTFCSCQAGVCNTDNLEIADTDLIIISLNKPDHCHQETPRQLRPEQKTIIPAELEAAKVIKKWNPFDPARVFCMPKCDPQKFLLLRFFIPPSGA